MRLHCFCIVTLLACDGRFTTPAAAHTRDLLETPLAPSHVPIHRLTNDELTNTVQDLLFTQARPGDTFPQSSLGESGFRNDSTQLAVTSDWVSRLYTAADALADEVIASKGTPGGAYARLVTCTGGDDCAASVLTTLAQRAYRRPVTDIAPLLATFKAQATFDQGIHDAIVAILLNPSFLFVWSDTPPNTRAALSDYELAARLSYFLWQTMPDDELFRAAGASELATVEGLDAQVQRMLQDARADRLAQTLAREWAGLARIESSSITGLDDSLRAAMLKETDLFISDLIKNDRPLSNLLTGDYTFVNKALADLYGLPFSGSNPADFVRTPLGNSGRLGVVTHASVLTATAGSSDYTHPVRRGFWPVQRIMCSTPPPPPPDVPRLDQTPSNTISIRDRLNAHVASPACNGCHVTMDVLGLGLENFDSFGRWRASYPGQSTPIDASGTLPGGAAFTTPNEMYAMLAEQASVKSCLARQMMSLALTRAVIGPADLTLARLIGQQHVTAASTFSRLISQIVQSPQFREQQGEAL